jgi:hypothetical protein
METDISILRKSGHFYFALTPNCFSDVKPLLKCPLPYLVRNVPFLFLGHWFALALFCFGLRPERNPAPRFGRRV